MINMFGHRCVANDRLTSAGGPWPTAHVPGLFADEDCDAGARRRSRESSKGSSWVVQTLVYLSI